MVSVDFAQRQIQRLAGLDRFPKDAPAAVAELAYAAATADSEEICKGVISGLVDNERECPKPADIRRVMYAENESKTPPLPRSSKCKQCGGIQFISQTVLVTRHTETSRDGEARSWKTLEKLITPQQITAVRAHLKPNQQIVDIARLCVCHAANSAGAA